MSRVMLLSEDESNVYLLEHLQKEGCEVMLMTQKTSGAWAGDIPRAADGAEAIAWKPDYVICDSVGFGSYIKRFRAGGAQIVGGSTITDMMASSPAYGVNFLDASKVPTCEHQVFKDVGDAIFFIEDDKNADKAWRLLLNNNHSIGYDNGYELTIALETLSNSGELPNKFVLTRDFPGIRGCDEEGKGGRLCMWSNFHLVGFVTPLGMMNPVFGMRVARGLGEGGITTLEGVTLFPIPITNPIVELTLNRLSVSLSKIDYTGPITLGCVVEPSEESSLDVWYDRICVHSIASTPPPGFWAAFLAGLELPLNLFLDRMLNPRRAGNPFPFWAGMVSSRKLTLPPYPMTEAPWITPAQKAALMEMVPPVTVPHKPNVLWNGVTFSEDESLKVCNPVLGYVVGKATSQYQSLSQIRTEFHSLGIPYAQMSNTVDETFEVDVLPLGVAERQLEWEGEEEDEDEPLEAEMEEEAKEILLRLATNKLVEV
jgi:hypothetical protein